ncbi:phosphoribosylformylglycinamidine synthase subunit PurQ [Litorimonas cladophorae]|uniref:Phosphoribosylformylglycinamidine synthase subunit PurQ n=1 Tax=Litorimonas cladophorae TaxID=1220491 RepID=A0A918NCG1_9PROT|nr:phosphoribosylformylglycinamidine synthase subunit PurQ [Litorimonas cladophorae]GGX59946.1 phosphoribosylformylglycinamidine synthase subunit PurQ [Litorimonas cladophorae]
MQTAVIRFPASNCDRDAAVALEKLTGRKPLIIWHRETELPAGVGFVVMPGGFSYGDYLRSGAIASRSPIVQDIKAKSERGLAVAGFCNGFQILTEAGMLPGALMRNKNLKFVCRPEKLTVTHSNSKFTSKYEAKSEVVFPVAHHDGNYFADKETVGRLEKEGRVLFRYTDNPNGSVNDIAGIVNEGGNVFGMMPHPERAIDPLHGGTDGIDLFKSILETL